MPWRSLSTHDEKEKREGAFRPPPLNAVSDPVSYRVSERVKTNLSLLRVGTRKPPFQRCTRVVGTRFAVQ